MNHEVRVLGRKGVLAFTLMGTSAQIPDLRQAAAALAKAGQFTDGFRYRDFDRASDPRAGTNLTELIAGTLGITQHEVRPSGSYGPYFVALAVLLAAQAAALQYRDRIAALWVGRRRTQA